MVFLFRYVRRARKPTLRETAQFFRAPFPGRGDRQGTIAFVACDRIPTLTSAARRPSDMKRETPEFSLVIPAYNEERRLPASMERILAFCPGIARSWELVVVVERSTDATARLAGAIAARHPAIRVLANTVQLGKGYALRCGVAAAAGDVVFTMDADLSVPLDHVPLFLDEFRNRPAVDVLVGNRQHPASRIPVRQSLLRERMGQAFNGIVRAAAGFRLRDTQCGFKALRREAARAIYERQTLDGFACDVEVLMLAERMGFRVEDLPVVWANSPDSRVRIVRDGFRMLVDVLQVRRIVERTLRERPYRRSD